MNRTDFQQLAEVRIEEAAVLLAQGKYDGAYYLAGYAVECGLKACIAKLTNQYDFPDKVFAQQCFTHELETLLFRAGLEPQLKADRATNPALERNWGIVCDWSEASRYTRNNRVDAQNLYDAITDPAHGVLPWIKIRW